MATHHGLKMTINTLATYPATISMAAMYGVVSRLHFVCVCLYTHVCVVGDTATQATR